MRHLLIGMSLFFVVSYAPETQACTCGPPPPLEHIEDASLVFGGQLISIEEHPSTTAKTSGFGRVEYRFKIGQVWIGLPQPMVSVFSDRTSCGAWFEVGEYYFVCAFNDEESKSIFVTGLCSSCPIELAVVARLELKDPVVIDKELAADRPTEEELEVLSNSDNWALAEQGQKALGILRAAKESTGGQAEEP